MPAFLRGGAKQRLPFILLFPLLALGCDGLFGPSGPDAPGAGPGKVLGLVEITLSVEPMAAGKSADAAAGYALNPVGSGGLQLQFLANGSFTAGTRGQGGVRYLWATFRVRNATAAGAAYGVERRNVTMMAVSTARSLQQTAVSSMLLFDGTAASPSLAPGVIPTGAVTQLSTGAVAPRFPDALQLFTESEAAAITPPSSVTSVFPYGFVVTNPKRPTDRVLPASPAVDQFDGVVTFAFRVPLQATPSADPFSINLLFLVVEDTETRLTQSPQEQDGPGTLGVQERAGALDASVITVTRSGGAFAEGAATRVVCNVRTAGTAAAPTARMFPNLPAGINLGWLVPDPAVGGRTLSPTARLQFGRCDAPQAITPGPSNFAVQGFQSAKLLAGPGGGYSGVGGQLVSAPPGSFFAGEEVEVVLTNSLGILAPVVGRYRVRTAPSTGHFTPVSSSFDDEPYRITTDGGFILAAGDLTGDGRLDLVGTNDFDLAVFPGFGDGFFGAPIPVSGTYDVRHVVLGDFNGDDRLDIAAAGSFPDDGARVWLNAGGQFPFLSPSATLPLENARTLAAGDLNLDGRLDLAVITGGFSSAAYLFLGNGSGGFSESSGSPLAVGSFPEDIALADVNGDNRLDVLLTTSGSDLLGVYLASGASFTPAPGSPLRIVGVAGFTVDAADLNGDGHLDAALLLVSAGGDPSVGVLLGDGTGAFALAPGSPTSLNMPFVNQVPRHSAAGDVNGDGWLDMVVTGAPEAYRTTVLFGDGAGRLVVGSSFTACSGPTIPALGDLDGNGTLDLALTCNGSSSFDRGIAVFKNN